MKADSGYYTDKSFKIRRETCAKHLLNIGPLRRKCDVDVTFALRWRTMK